METDKLKVPVDSDGKNGQVFVNNSDLGTYCVVIKNNKIGFGSFSQNASTGILSVLNSLTSSTGDLMQFKKNDVLTTKIDHNGILTTPSPVFTGAPTAPTATAGTNTTQLATTAFVQAEKKLVFRGLISQSGTSDPTLIVLENNTGLTMAVSRTGTGQYLIQPTVGSFDYSKTYYHLENNIDNDSNSIVLRMRQNDALGATTGGLKINTTSTSSGITTYFDSQLVKTPIEIIVYP